MNRDDEKDRPFPEGYEHVGERLTETQGRLQQIDEQIKNLPKDKGLTVEYRPPGFIGLHRPGVRDTRAFALKTYKDEIRVDELAKTEADTREADSPTRRAIRDRVRATLFPNPYRQVTADERAQDQNVKKDIEQSQDYMDALIIEHKGKQPSIDEVQVEEPSKQNNAMSMSARFWMSLNFTKATSPTDPGRGSGPNQSRERDQDMDRD